MTDRDRDDATDATDPARGPRAVFDRVGSDARERVEALTNPLRDRIRSPTLVLAVAAGVLVFVVSIVVFPYHSTNHDEAVYLQQAAMLQEGNLFLRPPVEDAFRPWFFVQDGDALYAKYTPVTAAIYALGKALTGSYRVALAVVAAGNVALTVTLGRMLFDRRTGIVAGVLLLASPLFLVSSSVFLSYAPTTLFNLAFAVAYLRAVAVTDETGMAPVRWSAVAGFAIGIAFFARPFTAVLFALPFVAHACYRLVTHRTVTWLTTVGATAVVGLAWVALTVGYNAIVTGEPGTFPYEAFAPRDGLGFGTREIVGYARSYTPSLALRANAEVVARLLLRWTPVGFVGVVLAAWGAWRARRTDTTAVAASDAPDRTDRADRVARCDRAARLGRALVAAVVPVVLLGNVLFWGNLNILGDLPTLTDGLIWTLGPYYHFDVLAPFAIFAAAGALTAADAIHTRRLEASGRRRQIATTVGLAALVVVASVGVGVLAVPLADNHGNSERLAAAYAVDDDVVHRDAATVGTETPSAGDDYGAPLDERPVVVFLPQIYGPWLNHPFQRYRNDPGFDDDVVYALDRGGENFAVTDAYPDRAYYRYTYRGRWAPSNGERVDPRLQRVAVARGDAVGVNVSLGRPDWVVRGAIELTAGTESVAYYVEDDPGQGPDGGEATSGDGTIDARLVVSNGTARLVGSDVTPQSGNGTISVASTDTIRMVATLDSSSSAGLTYRLETPVQGGLGDTPSAVLTPVVEACVGYTDCQGGAAYIPGHMEPGVTVSVETWAESTNDSAAMRHSGERRRSRCTSVLSVGRPPRDSSTERCTVR